jgi:hypothetical protein
MPEWMESWRVYLPGDEIPEDIGKSSAPMYPEIVLTKEQLAWCDRKGVYRRTGSLEEGLLERGYDTKDSKEELNVKGVIGEVVFCLKFGLNPGKDIRIDKAPDSGYDIMYLDKKIQVRLTRSRWGGLIVRKFDKPNFDYAVCIQWNRPVGLLLGFLPRWRLDSLKIPMEDQHYVPRENLLPIEWLTPHIFHGPYWLGVESKDGNT